MMQSLVGRAQLALTWLLLLLLSAGTAEACLEDDVGFEGNYVGKPLAARTALACQDECKENADCLHFTWYDGQCQLTGSDVNSRRSPWKGAVSGPKRCPEATFGGRRQMDPLHIQKTGTSIFKAVYLYKCETELQEYYGKENDLNFWDVAFNFSKSRQGKHCARANGMNWTFIGQGTSHTPLDKGPASGHFSYGINAVISMFRGPLMRIASHFVQKKNKQKLCESKHLPKEKFEEKVVKFSHAWSGCMTSMLTGERCPYKAHESVKAAASRVEEAKSKIDRMAFVGLTDKWTQSMCIFTKLFPRISGRPYPHDLAANVRPSKSYPCRDIVEEILARRNYTDWMDQAVYDHAVERFEKDLQQWPECAELKNEDPLAATEPLHSAGRSGFR